MTGRTTEGSILILVTLSLVTTGVVMVYSSSAVLAERWHGDPTLFLKKQMIWVVIGLLAMFLASKIPYRWWQDQSLLLMGLTVLALTVVLVPSLGSEVNGSRRWFQFSLVSIQPSELARITIVIYLAAYLVKNQSYLLSFTRGFLVPVVPIGMVMLLIFLEPDFGTAVVIGVVAGILLFVGGVRLRYLTMTVFISIPVLYVLIMQASYRKDRLLAFLDPWKDPTDKGFQIIQSLLAFGQGGSLGMGLGEGRQKLFFLPYPHTDFIYAVIGEELGLIGTLSILFLFVLFACQGIRVALAAPDDFGRYLGFGITVMIILQAQVNMAVVTGLLPTKGTPLPLLSYGGSSLVGNLFAIGILLSIAVARSPGGKQVRERRGMTLKRLSMKRKRRFVWGVPS